jgi:CheY-like chemotaxis protein
VRHLVTNAGEALAGAAGTIEVRTSRRHLSRADLAHAHGHPDPPPGEYLCLEVADRGHGMDEATRARVFEPFFTTRFPGRGLGLAAVLGIARAHQGVVQVASGVGEGTRVRVLLPCARGVPAETRVEGSPAGGARAARVLVVDDEAWVLDLTREFLERAGFEVVTAVGGRAGLECLRERAREISLVVLDLVMPDLEGEQVLEEMRRLAPEIPVLVATGLGGETAAQARALAGAAGLVRKPFEPEALVGRIRSLLRAPHSYG